MQLVRDASRLALITLQEFGRDVSTCIIRYPKNITKLTKKNFKKSVCSRWESNTRPLKKVEGRRFDTLLGPTHFYLLLWGNFSFYYPDRKSDEFSELYAPDLPLQTMRTTNKINGKWVKKRHGKLA